MRTMLSLVILIVTAQLVGSVHDYVLMHTSEEQKKHPVERFAEGTHKIQIMLTNPRSISTAFEKSMMARGDHKVFHEPWLVSFIYHLGIHDVFSQKPPQELIEAKNYEEVKALIYRYAKQQPVFLKDMVWSNGKEILNDDALLSDPQVVLSFLIRDPALSIESCFLKLSRNKIYR